MEIIRQDETVYCQEQHALHHYAKIMKATYWRNACAVNLQQKSKYYDTHPKIYRVHHHTLGKAEYALNLVLSHPMSTFSCGNILKSYDFEQQMKEWLK